MTERTLAVVDLGSNSGRVVVFRAGIGGHLEILADGRSPLRLALGTVDGRLTEEAVDRTVLALRDFQAIAEGSGVTETVAVATAAVREASNRAEVVRRIREGSGLDLRVISGEEEASLGFQGAVRGLPCETGLAVDLGGGSMELTRFEDRASIRSWTLDLGALALSTRFLVSDPPRTDELERLAAHVRAELATAGVPPMRGGEQLVGTGGTIRNLAKIDRGRSGYPIPLLHGYVLDRRRLAGVAGLVASRKLSRRRAIAGLNADRADSVVGGAVVASVLAEVVDAPDLMVSGQGLREGIAYDAMGIRPSNAPGVRRASLAALASRFRTWDRARAMRRAEIAARLQMALDPEGRPGAQERLEQAATILDVGRSIDYYLRYELTAEILTASDLAGFSHRKLAMLAAVVRQAGDPGASVRRYRPLLGADDRAPVARGAVLLAMADEIEHRTAPGGPIPVDVAGTKRAVEITASLFDPYRQGVLAARFQKAFGTRLRWRAP